ncbi:hypothetical protein D3C80_676780 [compost metagenome]
MADGVAVAVGKDHGAAWLGGTAEAAAVAQVDGGRARGHAIHGGTALPAGIAGRVGRSGVDHGTVGQRCRGGVAPVAVAIGRHLADRVTAAIGEGHGAVRFGGTAEFAAVARVDHGCRWCHAIDDGAGGRAAVTGGIHDHRFDHRAIGQWAIGCVRPVAVAVGSSLADGVAVAVGEHHGAARLGGTAEAGAVARVDLRRIGEVRGLHGRGRAAIAGRIGYHHGNRFAVGQWRIQWNLEFAVGADHHADVGLPVAVAVDAHSGARLGRAADAAAIWGNLQSAGGRRSRGVRRHTAFNAAATTAAAIVAVGDSDAATNDRSPSQQCSAGAEPGNGAVGASERLEPGQAFLGHIARHQRPIGSDRRQVDGQQFVPVYQVQLAYRLPLDIEVGNAQAFAGLQLHDQIGTAFCVARHAFGSNIQNNVTALGERQDSVVGDCDGGGRSNTLSEGRHLGLYRHT